MPDVKKPATTAKKPTTIAKKPATTATNVTEWLTIPDLVDILGESQSRVRRLIEDRYLVAMRVDGVLKVPALTLKNGEPLHELRGTVLVLEDQRFTGDEVVSWLLDVEPSLGVSPLEALQQGRKAEVRRVAQALA